MSLIMDATKAAQREKARRDSGARPDAVPLLVPLRSGTASRFNRRRVLIVAACSVAVFGIVWVVVQQTRTVVPRALPTPGPAVVSIAPESPITDTADASPDSSAPAQSSARPEPVAKARTRAPTLRSSSTPIARLNRVPTRYAAIPSAEAEPPDVRSQGQLDVAVEDPRELEVARLFSAGVAAHRSGDQAAARNAYERVLRLSPNYVDALNNLGVLLVGLGEIDLAEQTLRRAVALDPTNPGAWNNLGTVLRERGRSSDAIAAFQHALNLDPGHSAARVSLAQQYLVIGSLAKARQLLEVVLAGNQNLPEANYALGQVLERLGDPEGAIRAYATFLKIAPPSLAAYTEGVNSRVDALRSQRP